MIIYKDYMIITPHKCGTHTIYKIFEELGGVGTSLKHTWYPLINNPSEKLTSSDFDINKKYKYILVVRNPYDRVVSHYYDRRRHPKRVDSSTYALEDFFGSLSFISTLKTSIAIQKEDLCTRYHDNVMLSNLGTALNAEFIWHIETLKEDIKKTLGIDVNVTQEYKTPDKRGTFPFANFNDEEIEIMNNILRKEAVKLGYRALTNQQLKDYERK